MLTAEDPVVPRPRGILIAGVSGVGKTTLARRMATITGIRHTEIDALFHGPNWTKRPTFEADVATLTAAEEWITEWQYGSVRDLLAERADMLVWLDAPPGSHSRGSSAGHCIAVAHARCSGTATGNNR